MRVKICGITKPEQAIAIAELGATALGFICVPQSPRYIATEQIREIIAQLPANIDKIGVFVGTAPDEIHSIVTHSGLTGVQLHGEESPAFCQQIRSLLPQVEVIKALRLKSHQALDMAEIYFAHVDTLLLDAYHPQQLGGTGKTLNWTELQQFEPPINWLLAGGLTADNILDALAQLHPQGIDLSSGVERAPGDKDLDKVAQLLQQLSQLRKYQ